MKYKITSDRVAGRKAGDTVTDKALDGVNVEGLIAGGHLEPVKAAARRAVSDG